MKPFPQVWYPLGIFLPYGRYPYGRSLHRHNGPWETCFHTDGTPMDRFSTGWLTPGKAYSVGWLYLWNVNYPMETLWKSLWNYVFIPREYAE